MLSPDAVIDLAIYGIEGGGIYYFERDEELKNTIESLSLDEKLELKKLMN